MFGDFLVFQLLISSLIVLLEDTICVILIILTLLRFVVWHKISILMSNILEALGKKHVFHCYWWNVLNNQLEPVNCVLQFECILIGFLSSSSINCWVHLVEAFNCSLFSFKLYQFFSLCMMRLCCLIYTHLKLLCLPDGPILLSLCDVTESCSVVSNSLQLHGL